MIIHPRQGTAEENYQYYCEAMTGPGHTYVMPDWRIPVLNPTRMRRDARTGTMMNFVDLLVNYPGTTFRDLAFYWRDAMVVV